MKTSMELFCCAFALPCCFCCFLLGGCGLFDMASTWQWCTRRALSGLCGKQRAVLAAMECPEVHFRIAVSPMGIRMVQSNDAGDIC